MIDDIGNRKPITIRDLYPNMTDDDLAVAEANLKRYVEILLRIHERLKSEGKHWPTREETAGVMAGEDMGSI